MIMVRNGLDVIEFAKSVFGAELVRKPLMRGDGRLWNAEIRIGGATIMLGDADPGEERPGFLYVHVPDVDATFEKAQAAGASPIMAPQDHFYGERDGGVQDRHGNLWWIATHKEDVDDQELERRAREIEGKQ